MYTIIIADDEAIECRGQEQILQNSFSNIRLLPSAANGTELIERVREEQPDIIITDINMPDLNGLGAIGVLRNEAVHAQVIINTAYSEFEYAKEAISLGACAFLVKPLERQDYLKAVEKAMKAVDHERSLEFRTKSGSESYRKMVDIAGREVISSVILGKPNEEELQIWLENMGHTYWGGVFVVATLNDEDCLRNLSQIAGELLKNFCTFLSKVYKNMLILFLFPGEIVGQGNYQSWVNGLLLQIDQQAKKIMHQEPHFGVSRWRYDYEEMAEAYQEAVNAILMCHEEKICFYEKKTESLFYSSRENAFCLAKKLVEIVNDKDREKTCDFLKEQIKLWHTSGYTDRQMIVAMIENLQNCSRKISGHNIYSWQQLRQTFSALNTLDELAERAADYLCFLMHPKEKTDARTGYVMDALTYIENNFSDDITLEDAAASAGTGISSFYLSRLLTQQLSTSFVELLTSARINEAIRLMRQQTTAERNLSSQVGYQSAAYFYRVFKKNTGMTVGEMREFLAARIEKE